MSYALYFQHFTVQQFSLSLFRFLLNSHSFYTISDTVECYQQSVIFWRSRKNTMYTCA